MGWRPTSGAGASELIALDWVGWRISARQPAAQPVTRELLEELAERSVLAASPAGDVRALS
jgi:hypothetical protein